MMNRLITCAALGVALLVSTGCYSTPEGRLKPGVPFVRDSMTSSYEAPMVRIHDAAVAIIKKNGSLINDDRITNVLRGIVDQKNVWVKLDDSQPKVTKITIQVRGAGGGSDVDLAGDLDKQIYGYLLQNPK